MDFKQACALTIASKYFEANRITQDFHSLKNRIIYWDNKYPSISALQLASLSIANPPSFIYLSDSEIREICNKIFYSSNYLNS